MNKSGRSVKAKTFSENDFIQLHPYQELVIANGAMARLQARGKNFINVHLDGASFKPQVRQSYIFDGNDLGKPS